MTQAEIECERLMNDMLPLATQMLQQYQEFFPYGGAMEPSGEIVHIAGYDGNEQPSPVDIINLVKNSFIQSAKDKKYKATALIYDVCTTLADGRKSDAIAITLDHEMGYSTIIFLPYQVYDGKLHLGKTLRHNGINEIFDSIL